MAQQSENKSLMEEVYRRQFEQSQMDEGLLENIEAKATEQARIKSAMQVQPQTYLTGIDHEQEFIDERNLP
jgi:hypothetical protein